MRFEPVSSDPLHLAKARVHEAQGLGRYAFAVYQTLRHRGPLIWVVPNHEQHHIMPRGLPPDVCARVHIIRPQGEEDTLWALEDALRTKGVDLVVGEPDKPLSFLVGRRLQLAAEAGRSTGLMLIRQDHGSNAAETRWHCRPTAARHRHAPRHIWTLQKNKKGPTGAWAIEWDPMRPVGHGARSDHLRSLQKFHDPVA